MAYKGMSPGRGLWQEEGGGTYVKFKGGGVAEKQLAETSEYSELEQRASAGNNAP